MIKNEIVINLEKYKLIKDSQHGFVKKRSCLSNLLDFFEEVYGGMDACQSVDVIYLDFAKAFDTVPHQRLSSKLKAVGIGGNLLRWIDCWLLDRRQKVGVRGSFSKWMKITSGVPQGSVLGPLLFVVYINDLDEGIAAKISKFADDTKLCKTVCNSDDVEVLRNDLVQLFKWSQEWQMRFNVDKCHVMHMGRRNPRYKYELEGIQLKETKEEKDLGVLVNEDAKQSRQCAEVAKKENRILGMIKRTIVSRDKDTVLRLYKSLVRPHLEYCVQAWSPCLKKDIYIIEKVQRRATKMIAELKGLNYEQRLSRCNLTTLEKRRTRGDLIETYKLLNGLVDLNPERFFERSRYKSTRGHNFKLYKKRESSMKHKFFSARVTNEWNKLENEVVNAETVEEFKIKLCKYGF